MQELRKAVRELLLFITIYFKGKKCYNAEDCMFKRTFDINTKHQGYYRGEN